MSSVVDLVEPTHLHHLATPANLRLGREIAAAGGVEVVEFGTCRVTARVSNGQRRSVELSSTPQGLEWRCTCTKRPDLFCKHCVVVAVATWGEAPPLDPNRRRLITASGSGPGRAERREPADDDAIRNQRQHRDDQLDREVA